jgi:lambda repressor-like predicted transcriptional regulator
MPDRPTKPTHEELIAMLHTPGWEMETGSKAYQIKNRTLKELVETAHARRAKGEAIGPIKRIENAIEVDALQLQQLWMHLGLPM